jgi:hypothetical protein
MYSTASLKENHRIRVGKGHPDLGADNRKGRQADLFARICSKCNLAGEELESEADVDQYCHCY